MTNYSSAPPVDCPPGALPVPLRGRGKTIRGWVIVDAADYEWAMRHRWYLRPGPYAQRNLSRKETGGRAGTMKMHRELMGLGVWPEDRREVDHINRNGLDCRRSNMRIVTHKENSHNQGSNRRWQRASRYRGVSYRKDHVSRPWQAYCRLDGHLHHLGFHATELEAADAAAAFRREHMSHAAD